MSDLVDKMIENLDEVLNVNQADLKGLGIFTKEASKQRAYVKSSLHRCRRCGDHAVIYGMPLSVLCPKCEVELHEKVDGPVKWFFEMLDEIRTKAAAKIKDPGRKN